MWREIDEKNLKQHIYITSTRNNIKPANETYVFFFFFKNYNLDDKTTHLFLENSARPHSPVLQIFRSDSGGHVSCWLPSLECLSTCTVPFSSCLEGGPFSKECFFKTPTWGHCLLLWELEYHKCPVTSRTFFQTLDLIHPVFPMYSGVVLVLLIDCCPRQMPSWPTLSTLY